MIGKLESSISGPLKHDISNLKDFQDKLNSELRLFQDTNIELKKEVTCLRDLIKSKDDQISELNEKVNALELKLDDYEQYSRRNSLRISGIKETQSEDVAQKVLDVFNSKLDLDSPVTPDQVDRVHRVGPKKVETTRAILIKFATYGVRKKVFQSKKNLKAKTRNVQVTNEDNSDNRSVDDQNTETDGSIYINEDLTKIRANLIWKARLLKKDKKISDCWTHDGTILIKNNVHKIIPINTETELVKAAA